MSLVLDEAPLVTPDGTEQPSPLVGAKSGLYRLAGMAAALAATVTPISIGFFAASPPPDYDEGARVWFEHIQDNEFLGLMSLDLPFLVITVLMIPVMLALFMVLHEVRPVHILAAAVLYVIAVATYFGTNTSIEMLSLSDRFADATTEAQRISLLGAGETAIGAFTSTAFHVNYILAQIAGIIVGVAMLRTHIFSRAIAYLMIGGNAFGFLLYVPEIGVTLSALSGLILWVWMILVSRRLFQMARTEV